MLNKTRLLTPGPTPLPERVRLVLAQDMIHHRKSAFKQAMHATQEKLRVLFGTEGPVLPLSCSGTGAMTAALHGLCAPGERILVIEGGKFGQRWREIAQVRGLECLTLEVEWGQAVRPQDVARMLDAHPDIAAVCVQVSETSTGVLHPVRELAAVTRGRDVLLIADGISAVGISPCPMDEWGIDCLLTGSQKGLMLPPGLALLALSPRAWEKAAQVAPSCFYFNLLKERDNVLKGQTLFTSPVSLILGLAESLDMLLEAGLDAVYRKQWALTMMARTGAKALGLELFAPAHFTWGLTSVRLPAGISAPDVVKYAAEDYGVYLAGGQDRLKSSVIRIGHMGWVDWADVLAGLSALKASIEKAGGWCGSRDYLSLSFAAYRQALEGPAGAPLPLIHS